MIRRTGSFFVAAGLVLVASPILSGCSNHNSETPVAKEAERAVGLKPEDGTTKSVKTTRDVIVEEDKKVIDKHTGQVISESKVSTPVTIIEKKSEKTDIQVDVGASKTSGSPAPAAR